MNDTRYELGEGEWRLTVSSSSIRSTVTPYRLAVWLAGCPESSSTVCVRYGMYVWYMMIQYGMVWYTTLNAISSCPFYLPAETVDIRSRGLVRRFVLHEVN